MYKVLTSVASILELLILFLMHQLKSYIDNRETFSDVTVGVKPYRSF